VRNRLPALVLLACALTFLASLYLPWRDMSIGSSDGWSTEAGVAASLAALVLVAGSTAALVRQSALSRLPLAPAALAVLCLAVGSLLVLRAGFDSFAALHDAHFAYGAYIGIASAGLALLAAVALERASIRLPNAAEAVAMVLVAGLLASYLLDWATAGGQTSAAFPGVVLSVVVLAAGALCFALRGAPRLYAAAAIALLTGAGVNGVASEPLVTVRYGAWMALGFAVALVALAAIAWPRTKPALASAASVLIAGAAAVFVVSLFLPWQKLCAPNGQTLGAGLGLCVSTTGWATGEQGAVAGALALAVILAALVASRAAATLELALAIAILTASAGQEIGGRFGGAVGWGFGYGAYVGFAAAGVLLVGAFLRLRLRRPERGPALVRLVPLAAVLACFCAIALPLWGVLPGRWSPEVDVLRSWYAILAMLLTLHLIRCWLDEAGEQLVFLPLAVLALTAIDLVQGRGQGMTWGGGILVGLCLFLALLGWRERAGGLEDFHVPEILRVDRLPGES
jgi:hypothetical protein